MIKKVTSYPKSAKIVEVKKLIPSIQGIPLAQVLDRPRLTGILYRHLENTKAACVSSPQLPANTLASQMTVTNS